MPGAQSVWSQPELTRVGGSKIDFSVSVGIGSGVAEGGTGVSEGGADVAVGGTEVSVGGDGAGVFVSVGAVGVLVGAGSGV